MSTYLAKTYFVISIRFKRFVSDTPYLVEQTAVGPHVTGSGVLLVVKGLRGRPLDRDFASL